MQARAKPPVHILPLFLAASITSDAIVVMKLPSDAEIRDAKSEEMVWANKNTKVYHKGDSQYGKPKDGTL
jgi:hypothetical protein